MAISVSSIYDLTRPGLRGIEGAYEDIPTQWSKVFWQGKSNLGVERTAEVRMLPVAQLKTEGAPTAMDNNAGERFVYNHEHFEVGLGYAITRKAIDDNLYESEFPASNLGLHKSFAYFKEIQCANVFNTGNVYNSAVGGDGVALFSTSHPYDFGVWPNTPSQQLSLNEASLLTALTAVRTQFRDQAGLKPFIRGRRLLVHPQNEWVAARLWHTPLRPGTADNDTNAMRATGSLPDGYEVMDYFTSPYAWFLQTNYDRGLIYLQRKEFEMSMWVDDISDNLLTKAYERYFVGYANARGAWGTYPIS